MVPQLPRAELRPSKAPPRRAGARAVAAVGALLMVLGAAVGGADINRIVLRVNDQIATLYEFQQRRLSRIREIERADLPPDRRQRLLADVGVDTLREMYEELLVLSRADQLDVRISDREVQTAVSRTKRQFGIESDEEFRAALAASGMTLDDLAEQMHRNLLIREVMGREVQQRIQLEEEDLRRYYRDHPEEFSLPRRLQVREVVIPGSGTEETESQAALAAEVRAGLLAGVEGSAKLEALAESGQTTGVLELGWVERGDLGPTLERAIWELEAGAVSEPIAARGGLHVVEILAEEEATLQPFADVQEAIQRRLRGQRYQEELTDFLAELEDSSYVVQDPPPEAAGFSLAAERSARDELRGLGAIPGEIPEQAEEADPEAAGEPESGAPEPPE